MNGGDVFRFEKLDVWRKAVDLAGSVYRITRNFPDNERYGLVSQMRRAAVSVSSNIAEGSGRSTNRDFARFIEIAYGSVMEIVSQLHIAQNQSFLQEQEAHDLYSQADEVARMLSGLRSHLQRSK